MKTGKGIEASPGLLGSGSQTQLRKLSDMPRSERGALVKRKVSQQKEPTTLSQKQAPGGARALTS